MNINIAQHERDLIAIVTTTNDTEKASRVIDGINSEMFTGSIPRIAWKAIEELHQEGELVDTLGVAARMEAESGRDNFMWLVEITTDSAAQPSQLIHLAKRVRQSSYIMETRRRLLASLEVIDSLTDVSKANSIAESITGVFDGLLLETDDKKPQSFRDVAKNLVTTMQDKLNGKEDDHVILSRCADLDKHTGGFNRTDLITMGGLSGSGKTEFAVKIMRGIAKAGDGALIFTMEMSNNQVAERVVSGEAQLPVSYLRNPSFLEDSEKAPNGWDRVKAGLAGLIDKDIYMTDQTNLSIGQIVAMSKRHKRDHPNLGAIFVDHIGLMDLGKSANGRHDLQVGEISKRLKSLAKEINTPVILLTQLTGKQIMSRPMMEREPRAQDIKDSSRIEEDSDLILLCHRQWTHDESAPNIAEIILAKARHAIKGTKVYYRFVNGHFESTDQAYAYNEMDAYKIKNKPVAFKKSDKLK